MLLCASSQRLGLRACASRPDWTQELAARAELLGAGTVSAMFIRRWLGLCEEEIRGSKQAPTGLRCSMKNYKNKSCLNHISLGFRQVYLSMSIKAGSGSSLFRRCTGAVAQLRF